MDLVELVVQYGVTGGIALYLIYWMTQKMDNDLHEIKSLLREIKDILKRSEK